MRRNGCRICAARSVQADATHEWRGENDFTSAVKKNIYRRTRVLQMTPFDQRSTTESLEYFFCDIAHFLD